jgi:hypothetical protein
MGGIGNPLIVCNLYRLAVIVNISGCFLSLYQANALIVIDIFPANAAGYA